jgi:ABC-type nitrate/sulfonate/bicarbonate transport system substrate-binding protein
VNVSRLLVAALSAVVALGGLAACVGTSGPTPTAGPTKLTVGLGYIASVQFAQFYRAQNQGYYRAAGL